MIRCAVCNQSKGIREYATKYNKRTKRWDYIFAHAPCMNNMARQLALPDM